VKKKLEVLELIDRRGSILASDLIDLGWTRTGASIRLLAYQRQGLVRRVPIRGKEGRPAYRYELTEKGKQRLDWLRRG